MKQFFFIYVILCSWNNVFCQHAGTNPANIMSSNIPASETVNTTSIARYINSNYKDDREKFDAIYSWVTSNIKYDTDSMFEINWNKGGEAKITEALRRRKGVCENYTAIFNDVVNKCGLISFVVDGYTKQGGKIEKAGHSWNAVDLKGQWLLCDPTWDKDAGIYPNYYMVDPDQFIKTHMPFDPMWQLLNLPVSHAQFYRDSTGNRNKNNFNFSDSIIAFTQLSEVKQLEASAARISRYGILNDLIKNRVAYTNMLIGIMYEDMDMKYYNSAVADFNLATLLFNEFVLYRNNEFVLSKNADIYNLLLDSSEIKIISAQKKIKEIGRIIPNNQYDTEDITYNLENLLKKIKEQQIFMKNHFVNKLPHQF
jgi:hypothetical protein